MSQENTPNPGSNGMSELSELDVVIVGAGFAGLYLLHRLRASGMKAVALEAASNVGGTWYWNRYPGARCDVESMQYSFSFSEELQQQWRWSERFSAQPEILEYANHVADRFDLRRDIVFNTRVHQAQFDSENALWHLTTHSGDKISARFCIMATGCLSSARMPEIPGVDEFSGPTYHTGQWPHEPVDFSGESVGIIGTGSSAIQAIPVIAEQAKHVTVFQRTPNYSIPSRNAPMTEDYEQWWKSSYADHREQARYSRNGIINRSSNGPACDYSEAERREIFEQHWAVGGTSFMAAFDDLATEAESNESAAEFVREKIRETVKDPSTAELLAPKDYPIGTKRICVDSRYFETYNRDNVQLVDIKADGIERITASGLTAHGQHYEFDNLVFATGFDAMTGTLLKIDIRGRDNISLAERWEEGPRTYLGLAVAGFPNLFMVTGPGSPSVLSNMMVSIEQHVDWIVDALNHIRASTKSLIEAEQAAQDSWVEHVNEVAHMTLYPRAASWYMGANIPGKPRIFMPYIGGVGRYRSHCDEVANNGYEGFTICDHAGSTKIEDVA